MKRAIRPAHDRKVLDIFEYMVTDPTFKIRGECFVRITDRRTGKVIDEIDLGPNVVTNRARFVLSRLVASNLKRWNAGFVFATDWTTYVDRGYIGDVDPGAQSYPFADSGGGAPIGGISQELKSNAIFGGVQTPVDRRWPGAPGSGPVWAGGGPTEDLTGFQNNGASLTPCAYHHGNAETNPSLLYAIGVTGMAFGNCGHLMNPATLTSAGNDSNQFCLEDYNPVTDDDVPSKPAQPYDATDPGYSWPGGGTKEPYPNLHQPDSFLYEPVLNGVVPWGYAGVAGITDNLDGLPGVQALYEGNTTLYSETARYPLDLADGITLEQGDQVLFKTTVPADSELNQERNYGYGRRPRNWITEMGLLTGENLTVQSPDPRTTGVIDPSVNGLSNVYGAELVEPGYTISGSWYSALKALPKDYFTRLRDPNQNLWFLNAVGQLDDGVATAMNNTWNLVARKVFGVQTKQYEIAMSYLWRWYFG